MNPHDSQQKVLAWERGIGRTNPEFIKHAGIAEFEPVDRLSQADTSCVRHQQKRNGKPECKLPSFISGNTKVTSTIERVQPKRTMDYECGIKDEMTGKGLPRLQEKAAGELKRLDRVNAESVIDKMRRYV